MKMPMNRTSFVISRGCYALMLFLLGWTSAGRILDSFTDPQKTGWTEFTFQPGLGSFTEANGHLTIDVPGVNTPVFAATTKTSESFVLQPGRTLEFHVDLVSGNDPAAVAVLGWFPAAQSVSSLSGYGLAVSSDRIVVSKGLNKYFYDGDPPAKAQNVELVLSLTQTATNVVTIQTRILDKDSNGAVLFDKTFVDTDAADVLARGTDDPKAPWTGSGHVSLLNYADQPKSGSLPMYEVVYSRLQVFVLDSAVLDDFSAATRSGWTDFTFQPGLGTFTQSKGQLVIDVPGVGQPLFAETTRTTPTLTVTDGERIELRVDLVSGNDPDAVGVLAWFPEPLNVSTLSGYGLAVSSDRIVVSKGLNKYFYDGAAPTNSSNIQLSLSLTGSGTSVIIEPKILDKNNNNAVIFYQKFVDTTGADVLARGTDSPAVPWTGTGHFALMNYADEPSGATLTYEVIFANAQISAPPAAGNVPAVIANIQPLSYTNYVPASAGISFTVTDDKPLVDNQITLQLNGQTVSNTNGLAISGSGTNRTVAFNGLQANQNYVVSLRVVDSDGVLTSSPLYFDTFTANDLVIEAEDYNFSSGQYFSNPVPVPEGSVGLPNSYSGETGMQGIDYQTARTDFSNAPYRPGDNVRMDHTQDVVRQKFTAAGGTMGSVYDYALIDIAANDWFNYTRNFPAGSYNIYLREALFNGAQAKADLALVTSDPSQPNQTTKSLGSFLALNSGLQYPNVPLTDGLGQNKIVVKLSGVQTLRLTQATSDPSGGAILQNYFILVPVADTGVQRAAVTSVSPAAGADIQTATPTLSVTIQNRDTTVQTNSILLTLNGATLPSTITANTNGATVTAAISPLPASGATNTARITFNDSQSVSITNEWSFVISYASVDPVNRQAGAGQDRGFKVRVVQAPQGSNLANSLIRAEDQLAANSTIPKFVDTNYVADVVNYDQNEGATHDFGPSQMVPGLDPASNGTDDYAMEVEGYLDLLAGVLRFGVISDDGYKVVAGPSLSSTDPSLAFHNGGPANETFDFLVPQAGLYPFRMVWYNRGGAGYAEWFSVDPATGNRTLINDPNSANAIKAYRTLLAPTLVLQSVAQLGTAFADETSATVDTAAKTVTFARPTGTRFYRLRSSTTASLKILSIAVSGNNVVLSYGPAQ